MANTGTFILMTPAADLLTGRGDCHCLAEPGLRVPFILCSRSLLGNLHVTHRAITTTLNPPTYSYHHILKHCREEECPRTG